MPDDVHPVPVLLITQEFVFPSLSITNGLLQSLQACFFFFRLANPPAVFLAVRITQLLEEREQPFFPFINFSNGAEHFQGSYFFVFPNHDFNRIARPFVNLLAYRLKHRQHVLGMSVLDE